MSGDDLPDFNAAEADPNGFWSLSAMPGEDEEEELEEESPGASYGSLLSLKVGPRKKKPIIELDAEVAEKAAHVMELNAATLMQHPENNSHSFAALGLDPLGADDDEHDEPEPEEAEPGDAAEYTPPTAGYPADDDWDEPLAAEAPDAWPIAASEPAAPQIVEPLAEETGFAQDDDWSQPADWGSPVEEPVEAPAAEPVAWTPLAAPDPISAEQAADDDDWSQPADWGSPAQAATPELPLEEPAAASFAEDDEDDWGEPADWTSAEAATWIDAAPEPAPSEASPPLPEIAAEDDWTQPADWSRPGEAAADDWDEDEPEGDEEETATVEMASLAGLGGERAADEAAPAPRKKAMAIQLDESDLAELAEMELAAEAQLYDQPAEEAFDPYEEAPDFLGVDRLVKVQPAEPEQQGHSLRALVVRNEQPRRRSFWQLAWLALRRAYRLLRRLWH